MCQDLLDAAQEDKNGSTGHIQRNEKTEVRLKFIFTCWT